MSISNADETECHYWEKVHLAHRVSGPDGAEPAIVIAEIRVCSSRAVAKGACPGFMLAFPSGLFIRWRVRWPLADTQMEVFSVFFFSFAFEIRCNDTERACRVPGYGAGLTYMRRCRHPCISWHRCRRDGISLLQVGFQVDSCSYKPYYHTRFVPFRSTSGHLGCAPAILAPVPMPIDPNSNVLASPWVPPRSRRLELFTLATGIAPMASSPALSVVAFGNFMSPAGEKFPVAIGEIVGSSDAPSEPYPAAWVAMRAYK